MQVWTGWSCPFIMLANCVVWQKEIQSLWHAKASNYLLQTKQSHFLMCICLVKGLNAIWMSD
jgi:hypothetical protein